jgi:hypothetical protein
MMIRGLKTPAKAAAGLAAFAQEFKQTNNATAGEVYASDLTEDVAKKMQQFGPPDSDGPAITEAKGWVKFWLIAGALVKYEFMLKGKIDFNGNSFPSERTTTVEIKDVGKTKLAVPEAAPKKLAGGA